MDSCNDAARIYIDDYLDSVENLPDDIQRQLTRMREMDVLFQTNIRDVSSNMGILVQDLTDEVILGNNNPLKRKKIITRLEQLLMNTQDVGDDKLQLVQNIQDLMDNRTRVLDQDARNLDMVIAMTENQMDYSREHKGEHAERTVKRARRARHEVFVPSILGPTTLEATSFSDSSNDHPLHVKHSGTFASNHTASAALSSGLTGIPNTLVASARETSGRDRSDRTDRDRDASTSESTRHADKSSSGVADKNVSVSGSTSSNTPKKSTGKLQVAKKEQHKQKRRSRQNDSPPHAPIDPDEPTYCLCDQVSYGEMIGCDNDLCPIEWFHFLCVNLSTKPKGKWFCPKCRGDRPNVMKPKHIFLKELEKYNKEKEEKA